jgi:hypothetical protein
MVMNRMLSLLSIFGPPVFFFLAFLSSRSSGLPRGEKIWQYDGLFWT